MKTFLPRPCFFLAGVVLLALAALYFLMPRPPAHGGYSAHHWLNQVTAGPRPQDHERAVLAAFEAMGPSGIRWLTGMAKVEVTFAEKLNDRVNRFFRVKASATSASQVRRQRAIRVLGMLGTNAVAAIPALRDLSNCGDENIAVLATAALVQIGDLTVEQLLADYRGASNSTNQDRAYYTLLLLVPNAKAALPVFLGEVDGPEPSVRQRALAALRLAGMNTPGTIEELTPLLSDPAPLVRANGIIALFARGPAGWRGANVVAEKLGDPDPHCRHAAVLFFGYAPSPDQFSVYAPLVSRLTNDPVPTVRHAAERLVRVRKRTLE